MRPSNSFKVVRRNHGHWDIIDERSCRVFRVRGAPGAYVVMNELAPPFPVVQFKTVSACMMFICEILMHEDLQLNTSNPIVVDSNGNVPATLNALDER